MAKQRPGIRRPFSVSLALSTLPSCSLRSPGIKVETSVFVVSSRRALSDGRSPTGALRRALPAMNLHDGAHFLACQTATLM